MNQSEYRYHEKRWRYCSLALIHRNEYVNSLPLLCLISLPLCLIGSLFGPTSNFQREQQISATLPLCVRNPPVTGWFRSDKDLSRRWFETPWRPCDVTVLWCPVCACKHIDTHTEIEERTMSKLKSIISSSCTEFNCWGANATGWHHYINLHGDNSQPGKENKR